MSQQVLNPGLDPTYYPGITAAQLLQMVEQATFATGVGGVLVTTDSSAGNPVVPNPNVDPTLANYIWVRVGNVSASGNFASAYVWNPNNPNSTNPTQLLNWNPVTTLSGSSIDGSTIVSGTIPATALAGGISASQVTGLSNLLATALTVSSSPAAGAISGSFLAGFSLSAGAVTASSFATGAINSNGFFGGQVVEPKNIATDTSGNNAVIMSSSVNAIPTWVSKAILALSVPASGVVDTGYIPQWQSTGSYSLVSPASLVTGLGVSASCTVTLTPFGVTSITATNASNVWSVLTPSGNAPVNGSVICVQYAAGVSGTSGLSTYALGTWTVANSGNSATNFTFSTTTAANASATITTVLPTFFLVTFTSNADSITSIGTNNVVDYANLFLNFTNAAANTLYATATESYDASSAYTLKMKVMSKATTKVTVQIFSTTSAGTMTTSIQAGVVIPAAGTSFSIICS